MDPKLSNLDPKLQDAYNRVMGTSPAGSTPPPQNPDPSLPNPFQQPVANTPIQTPPQSQNQNAFDTSPQSVSPPPMPDPVSSVPPQPTFSMPPAPPPPMPSPVDTVQYQPTPPAPAPITESAPAPTPVTSFETSAPASPATPLGSIPGVNSTVAFNATNSGKNVGTTPVKKGGLHIMPVVIGLGIVVLLVAYTFAWILLFNVEIPFL